MATRNINKKTARKKRTSHNPTLDLRKLRDLNLVLFYLLALGDADRAAFRPELIRRGYLNASGYTWTTKLHAVPAVCECGEPDCGPVSLAEGLREHLFVWDGRAALNSLQIDTRPIAPAKKTEVVRG